MPSYLLAPQVPPYIPDPGAAPNPLPPCSDPEVTPAKVCGSLTPPATGETVELQWHEITVTTSATPGAATPLVGTATLVRQASISTDATNSANVGVGPNSSANLFSIPADASGYDIPMPDGTSFDLADWFCKSTAASQTLRISYLPG